MSWPLVVIFATVALDAAGIALIFPILPSVPCSLTGAGEVAAQRPMSGGAKPAELPISQPTGFRLFIPGLCLNVPATLLAAGISE
jgi:hypothetical protein